MMGRISNERGFSAVEAILVLIIVGILGFTGWYVWHAKQNADASLNNSTAQKPVLPTTPKTDLTFKVPELKAELVNVPDSLQDLTYAVNISDDTVAQVDFSTASLTKLDPRCSPTANVSDVGHLNRYAGKPLAGETGQLGGKLVKQFDGFWIATFDRSLKKCSDNPTTEKLHQSQAATFNKLVADPANLKQLR